MSICDVRWKSIMWCCVYQGDIGQEQGMGKKSRCFTSLRCCVSHCEWQPLNSLLHNQGSCAIIYVSGYTKKTFAWDKYLTVCRSTLAPAHLFRVGLVFFHMTHKTSFFLYHYFLLFFLSC